MPVSYQNPERTLRCPLCHGKIHLKKGTSLVCENKHCFDISEKGYVNFLPNQKKTLYSKELFEARRQVFEDGFYDHAVRKMTELIKKYCPAPHMISDIGCGEGWYLHELENPFPNAQMYGVDIVRDAIAMAATLTDKSHFIVGDLADLPLHSCSTDVLLNILTPANYAEFNRILKSSGIVIKVIPGENYLREIRECVKDQLSSAPYSDKQVREYFGEHMRLAEAASVCTTLPVTKTQLDCFLKMTPMTFHVDTSAVDTSGIHTITIHFVFLIGKKQKNK